MDSWLMEWWILANSWDNITGSRGSNEDWPEYLGLVGQQKLILLDYTTDKKLRKFTHNEIAERKNFQGSCAPLNHQTPVERLPYQTPKFTPVLKRERENDQSAVGDRQRVMEIRITQRKRILLSKVKTSRVQQKTKVGN